MYLGDEVKGRMCPNGHRIYYNGNYFCEESGKGEYCWIMDPDDPDTDLIEAYLKQRGLI